jgi:hypothetical protein
MVEIIRKFADDTNSAKTVKDREDLQEARTNSATGLTAGAWSST